MTKPLTPEEHEIIGKTIRQGEHTAEVEKRREPDNKPAHTENGHRKPEDRNEKKGETLTETGKASGTWAAVRSMLVFVTIFLLMALFGFLIVRWIN